LQADAKLHRLPHANVSFLVGDIEHVTFQGRSFDAILCASSVPYLNMTMIAKKLHGWLKPNAKFIYDIPEVLLDVPEIDEASTLYHT